MTKSNKSISPLRQRMLEDMTIRKLGPKTQKDYIRAVVNFTRHLKRSPDTATAEDLRDYQLHMARQRVSSGTWHEPFFVISMNNFSYYAHNACIQFGDACHVVLG